MVEAIARNIKKCESLLLGGSAISSFLSSKSDIGRELWNQCKDNLASKFNQTTNFEEAEAFIDLLCRDHNSLFRDSNIIGDRGDIIGELCDLLNPKRVAKNILRSEQWCLDEQCGSEGLCDSESRQSLNKFLALLAKIMPEAFQDIMQFFFYGLSDSKRGGYKMNGAHLNLLKKGIKNGQIVFRLPIRITNTDHKRLE